MTTIRILLLALAFAGASIIAHAAPQKLKVSAALELRAALQSLDGFPKPVGAGEKATTINQPYDFALRVRITIAKNLAALNHVAAAHDAKRRRTFNEIAGAAASIEDPAKKALYLAREAQAGDDEVEVDLQPLSEADLNLEANPELPGTVLAALIPYLGPPAK